MKKIFLILSIAIVASISIEKADALQSLQIISEGDECNLDTCPGGHTNCCTTKAGTTYYNKN